MTGAGFVFRRVVWNAVWSKIAVRVSDFVKFRQTVVTLCLMVF